MNRWKVITGILLIFVVGIFSGALGTGVYTKKQIRQFMDPKGPPPPIRILERQLAKLDLSSEQRHKTDLLLAQMHAEFIAVIRKTKPEMEAHFKRHVNLLRAELTPAQQNPFDNTIQRIQERLDRMLTPPMNPTSVAAGLRKLEIELELTPEQIAKSDSVIKSMKQKEAKLLDRLETDRALRHQRLQADMKALMDRTQKELEAFLSAEQARRLREAHTPSNRP